MEKEQIIVAVDGLSGSGKSFLCKEAASYFNFDYLNVGLVYRAITVLAINNNLEIDNFNDQNPQSYQKLIELLKTTNLKFSFDAKTKDEKVEINEENVTKQAKSSITTNLVPKISCIEEIRKWVRNFQYSYAKGKNIIMEGRDITTVIFPNAKCKIYITISPEISAERRRVDFEKQGEKISIESIIKDLELRNKQDMERKHSPLKIAEDAFILDTSHRTKQENVNAIIEYIKSKI